MNESELFNCCLDVTDDTINVYATTNNVAGATIFIEELESINSGFIHWKNFEKFEFSQNEFTKMVKPISYNKLVKPKTSFIDEVILSHSAILNRGTSVAPMRYQRELSDGNTIEGNIFVTSNGKLFIGLRGQPTEVLGNEIHSALRLDDSEIQFIGDFLPDITNRRSIGNANYKVKNIYCNSIILTPVTSLPTTGLYNGYTVFYATIKMQCTYYNGKWYNSNGEEINN